MKSKTRWTQILGLLFLTLLPSATQAAVPVSELSVTARDGQAFLRWTEAETPADTTFNVYVSESAITDVAKAKRIGHHIERHSARDWWEDPASFKKHVPAAKPVGFRIQSNAPRLDPQGGLFVHTIRREIRNGDLVRGKQVEILLWHIPRRMRFHDAAPKEKGFRLRLR
jgi:hypothetical protein